MDKNKSIQMLMDLTDANGVSRFELGVVNVAKAHLKADLKTAVDRMNNLKISRSDEDVKKPLIYLDSHSDELGLMVQSITSRGLLRVSNIGGWEPKNLLAQKFRMVNKKGEVIKGIVATVPVHFLTQAMRDHTTTIEDLLVDIGVNTREEALELGVYIGMPMIPDVKSEYFERNGGVVMAKALDNRVGCSLVADVMNSDYNRERYEIRGFMVSQEEIGARGAEIVANTEVKPDVVIVFEGAPSDDGHVPLDEAQTVSGGGVQIRLKDNGMYSDPAIADLAIELAKKNGIDYQVMVRSGGSTNGARYHSHGVPSLVLSVPVRFAHSSHSLCKMSDYEATYKLAMLFIEEINKNGLPENREF